MPKINSKTIASIIGIILLIEVVFGPISIAANFVQKIKTEMELTSARELWNSKGSKNYKIKVRGMQPLECVYDARITVQNSELVKVEVRKKPFDEQSDYRIIEKQAWNPDVGCHYAEFTIPQVLINVKDALTSTNPLTQKPTITFNSAYGYVSYHQIYYSGNGLLNWNLVSDCCAWYEFSDYEPIE